MNGDVLSREKSVVVIGAGTMGSGIAEVAASAGHRVYLRDTNQAALDKGFAQIQRNLAKRVERGRLTSEESAAIIARLTPAMLDTLLVEVGLVIEVIVEDIDAKVAVLSALEVQLDADVIIATNTSSLSVTALAGRLQRPERVVGMHFFNPAPILPLVEVVRGQVTADAVVNSIVATAKAWGKVPVVCRSTPGFIVNRIARPFYGEALRALQEQVTNAATLDAVMRECGGFRMGPCELMDLIGHDVNFAVTRSVYESFYHEPRYRPSLVQKDLVDAGWLGRKSGRGFFDYRAGAVATLPDAAPTLGNKPQRVRIEGDLGPANALVELFKQADIQVEITEGSGVIRVEGIVLALSDGRSATERALALNAPVVLFDLALDYAQCKRIALAAALQVNDEQLSAAIGLFTALGKQVSLLADVPGMLVLRTVAMLINEAGEAVQHGIAIAEDIDTAMQLGVNYPLGPLAWGQRVGLSRIVMALTHLAAAHGADRYRTSVWLRQAVHAAIPVRNEA